jgi:outer membrane protein TolC
MRWLAAIGLFGVASVASVAWGDEPATVAPSSILLNPAPIFANAPKIEGSDQTYPISLPIALQLAGARPLDVAFAARQVDLAARQYQRARTLWLPNITFGADYFRHEGGQQNFAGEIPRSSRGSVAVGLGPNLVFSSSDAIYAPLASRQDFFARTAFRQAALNDVTLTVAEVYFAVQQARSELAGASYAQEQTEEVARKAVALAEGLIPPFEGTRAKVELARRKQAVVSARERWRIASAELSRLLRLPGGVLVEPIEPPTMSISLIGELEPLEKLIPQALANRPELAGHQAIVQATLTRLKQEKLRPILPSLAIRSTATNPSGSLGLAGFGGGPNDRIGNFGTRFDIDVQLLWEFSALGFGNKARVGERKVEVQLATLELFRTQDRIAAEVTIAHTQLAAARERLTEAEPALRDSLELVSKSVEGMGQTRRSGEFITLIVRPQEVVAAIQTLAAVNSEYANTLADFNRAQFRLYRALGQRGDAR